MDLSGSEVGELDVQLNAGSLSLLTDAETQLTGRIGVNAGSVDLCTDPEAGLRITVERQRHLRPQPGRFRACSSPATPTPATTSDPRRGRSTLELEGNAASFTLNPEEGCA